MAKQRCVFCGRIIRSEDGICSECGGRITPKQSVNEEKQTVAKTPETVEELLEFCHERGMPLERMRFFIGIDYKEPKAFGIYQNELTGSFVVYKNKADGTRAIRYNGQSEAYAVKELYEKLLDECHNRGIYPETSDGRAMGSGSATRAGSNKKKTKNMVGSLKEIFIISASGMAVLVLAYLFSQLSEFWQIFIGVSLGVALFVGVGLVIFSVIRPSSILFRNTINFIISCIVLLFLSLAIGLLFAFPKMDSPDGYYRYNNNIYYMQGYSYYQYNHSSGKWSKNRDVNIVSEYYLGSDYDDSGISFDIPYSSSFESSTYYNDSSSDSSSSSYYSWDSGGTDWSSDW